MFLLAVITGCETNGADVTKAQTCNKFKTSLQVIDSNAVGLLLLIGAELARAVFTKDA